MKTSSLSRPSDSSPHFAAASVRRIVSQIHVSRRWLTTGVLLMAMTGAVPAQIPQLINFQGRVAVAGVNFDGTGQFKFALVDGSTGTAYWSNSPDTTPVDNIPDAAVSLTVSKGLYSVLLGDGTLPNMAVVPATVFSNSDVRLRVWFNDGTHGSQQLTPDQRIAAVGYAMMAGTLQSGATITSKTSTPAVSLANSTDKPATLSIATPYRTWWVGQNKEPSFADQFFIHDQTSNATRLRIDTTGVIYGNGGGLTNLRSSMLTGTIPASQVALPPSGMVMIPDGAFTMGNSVASDTDITDAVPVSVTLSAYLIATKEVTVSQWQAVYYWATSHGYSFSTGSGQGKSSSLPVQTVNWHDAVKWCNARSEMEGLVPCYTVSGATYKTGNSTPDCNWSVTGYRLPSEAEWEKAARGGVADQRFPWGNIINQNLACYYGNTSRDAYDLGPDGDNPLALLVPPATCPVGSFAANAFGVFDMIGNVREWCWDWYETPYSGGINPHGPISGTARVHRGGAWDGYAHTCRLARRGASHPQFAYEGIGFRIARSIVP